VAAGDEVAVPAQDGVGAYQQPQAAQRGPGETVEQRGQKGPIGRREPDFVGSELALQHGDLVAQHQNFCVPIVITHREQAKQRERVRDTQVGQSQQHGRSSCHAGRQSVLPGGRDCVESRHRTALASVDGIFGRRRVSGDSAAKQNPSARSPRTGR
jgi:hypothetical protein